MTDEEIEAMKKTGAMPTRSLTAYTKSFYNTGWNDCINELRERGLLKGAGEVIVPSKATPEMKKAGAREIRADRSGTDIAMDVYDAMLAAAP